MHQANQTANSSKLTLRFDTVLQDPFNAEYKLDPFDLDLTRFTSGELETLKSFKVATQSCAGSNKPDLSFSSAFELEIDTESSAYKEILAKGASGPPIADDLYNSISNTHTSLAEGIVNYLAWLYGDVDVEKLDTKLKNFALSWDFNGQTRNDTLPLWARLSGVYLGGHSTPIDLSRVNMEHFYALRNDGRDVPLHQELLSEVRYLLKNVDKRRSTYLILYSALEVATKNLIALRKPDAAFLITNMQSPELAKLYKGYINDQIANLVNKDELKDIKEMTETRNKIAHQGTLIDSSTLFKHYYFVVALLRKIDRCLGYI